MRTYKNSPKIRLTSPDTVFCHHVHRKLKMILDDCQDLENNELLIRSLMYSRFKCIWNRLCFFFGVF